MSLTKAVIIIVMLVMVMMMIIRYYKCYNKRRRFAHCRFHIAVICKKCALVQTTRIILTKTQVLHKIEPCKVKHKSITVQVNQPPLRFLQSWHMTCELHPQVLHHTMHKSDILRCFLQIGLICLVIKKTFTMNMYASSYLCKFA